jgi:hypothetical protein
MSADIQRMADEMALRDKLYGDLLAALASSPALSVDSKLTVLSTVMLTIALERGDLGHGVAQVREAIDRSIDNLYAAELAVPRSDLGRH